MPSNTTMNLSHGLYRYMRAAVRSGRYTSASAVGRKARREKKEGSKRGGV